MAIAYESIATTDFTEVSPGTLVITKPTGTALNDTLVAYLVWDTNSTDDVTLPSGWTQLYHDETGTRSLMAYVVVTSTQVAASNFTFTLPPTVTGSGGSIMRFSGVGQVNVGTVVRVTTNTSTPSFAGGVTPLVANSYLVMAYHAPFTQTTSGYAITNDNPTWTEISDENNVTPDLMMSLAYASRPQTTATGNFTLTTSGSFDDHNGVLLYLYPRTDVNLSMPVGLITLNGLAPTLTVDVNLTMPKGDITLAGLAPTLTTRQVTQWTPKAKPSPSTWTPKNK